MARKEPSTSAPARAIGRPTAGETISIGSHRELFARAEQIAGRVAGDPAFSVMFLSNPVLALQAYGVKLSRKMQHHVLETLRHPPKLRARREALEASLAEELGEPPRPTAPPWMASLVFEVRRIAPRAIGDRAPAYRPALNAASLERLQAARPLGGTRYPGERRLRVRFSLGVAPESPSLRRLDLDTELPELGPGKAPRALSLEQAWFYKDDPVVRDAVELGQIMRRGFPFRTPAEFRAIVAGKKVDAFRSFIRNVRLRAPEGK